ncbi:collagen-like triple helix repeat-containing protein, partial [Lactococcus lactis]|uniref:collagen-like triple helix repeat-containing protein n=1 Tax=Lactococcus lactis TaxID=1358 RepID=UPI003D10DBBB
YDWFRFYLRPNSTMPNMTKVAIKPNTKYTFSVLLKGTGQHTIYAYQNWTAPNTPWTLQINLTSEWKIYTFTVTSSNVIPDRDVQFFIRSNNGTEINLKYPKVEEGSTATPYMQSASEVTTADYPSYIGQYTDFAQADSTNPSDYTWSLIRGNDGERGPQGLKGDPGATGIPGQPGADGKTSYLHIAYATNSTGTAGFDVSNATGKTYIGQYTDFTSADSTDPSKYTWSLIKGDKGDKGERGIQGPAGSNGDPGKIVSDTEPTTRFKGLTWKYLGMSDLTASDGTVILSGTEYYWSGTNWILNEINAHNINGDNLSVTNGTFTDGKIKSTWNSGTASGSTEIENSHINMSATNSSSKVTNSLGLDIQQGFGMRWTDPASNQSRSVSLDYGNLAFDRNGVAAGLNFDGANLSSSMPIQAPNTIVKSTQFSVSGIGIRLDRMMSFVAVTFSGQASSTINNSPTIINVLPDGFRPISPYSIDYMVPGNTANNGYIYFNPDGSIRIMATINSGYYIRGTRFYITNDVYPS